VFAGSNDKNTLAQPQAPSRPVFGVPLKEAVAISRIRPGLELPAVVYRCVEYLEAKVSSISLPSFPGTVSDFSQSCTER
jgi:hypothetical protein